MANKKQTFGQRIGGFFRKVWETITGPFRQTAAKKRAETDAKVERYLDLLSRSRGNWSKKQRRLFKRMVKLRGEDFVVERIYPEKRNES